MSVQCILSAPLKVIVKEEKKNDQHANFYKAWSFVHNELNHSKEILQFVYQVFPFTQTKLLRIFNPILNSSRSVSGNTHHKHFQLYKKAFFQSIHTSIGEITVYVRQVASMPYNVYFTQLKQFNILHFNGLYQIVYGQKDV